MSVCECVCILSPKNWGAIPNDTLMTNTLHVWDGSGVCRLREAVRGAERSEAERSGAKRSGAERSKAKRSGAKRERSVSGANCVSVNE